MRWFIQNNYVTRITAALAIHLRTTQRDMLDFSVSSDTELPAHILEAAAAGAGAGGHFFYGSTALERIIARQPALAIAQLQDLALLDPKVWGKHRPGEMLNAEVERMPLEALMRKTPRMAFFVKPATEQKAFTGMVITGGDLRPLFAGSRGQDRKLDPALLVDASPVQELVAEYRFVVAPGEVVSGSMYREREHTVVRQVPADTARHLASHLVHGWLPSQLSVMDVAVLANGKTRIIEFNSIHSAGHYAMDKEKICLAVEKAVAKM